MSINNALSNTKSELYENLYVHNNNNNIEENKNIQKRQESIFRLFFSTLKSKQREGGRGRIFITGVTPIALNDFTSGFNIS